MTRMVEFEARTNKFFSQEVQDLADRLLDSGGMIIAIPGTTIMVRVSNVLAYHRETGKNVVGERYKDWGIEDLTPGDLWNTPSRRILQSLVIAQGQDGVGACVRLLSTDYWNPLTERFADNFITGGQEFSRTREGDIAKFLGLQSYERSSLKFLDDSNTLYVVRNGQIYNRKRFKDNPISSEKANHQLNKLLDN